MSSPKNLTGSITQLRERKGQFHVGDRDLLGNRAHSGSPKERTMAGDLFLLFAFALVGATMLSQLMLLLWLDLL